MIDHKGIKKGIVLTVGLGALVKQKLDKELTKAYKKGHITKTKQRDITKKVVKKAIVEGKKIEKYVVAEAIKELKLAINELEKSKKLKKPVKKKSVKKKQVSSYNKRKVTKKKVVKKKKR